MMALRWHPDRNPGTETVYRMQSINEAYLMLSDLEARARYDKEYHLYHRFKHAQTSMERTRQEPSGVPPDEKEYVFADEILKRWMQNAHRQAAELSRMTQMEFMKGDGAAAEEMGKSIVSYLMIGIIFLLILAASKGCQ